LAIYDGVVTIADDNIPVIVELDEESLRLSASGQEIGQWPTGQCRITHLGEETYAITAEEETIEFIPNRPDLFANAVDGASEPATDPPPPPEPDPNGASGRDEARAREAPPPKPVTMGLFYALCFVTAGLAIWSLISIIF
jgi:hypothetical protein